jgi:chloramphenicol 3-O phosphotransferase
VRDHRPGWVLVLNGTSSSGKTSLGRALQERWAGPLLDAGLDRHLEMLPRRYLGAAWPEVYAYAYTADGSIASVTVGPVGEQLHRAMHRSVAALARSGVDVVVDHVLLERRWAVDLAQVLEGVPAALVGVRCPVDVLAARERARADRTVGQSVAQHQAVHSHGAYDVEVDTSVLTADEAAERVVAWLAGGPGPTALARLRR